MGSQSERQVVYHTAAESEGDNGFKTYYYMIYQYYVHSGTRSAGLRLWPVSGLQVAYEYRYKSVLYY